MRAAGALLGLLAAAASSGCLFSAEGELPEVEVTQQDILFPGVPREVRLGEASIALPIFLNPGERLGLPPESYKSVKVKDVSLVLKAPPGGDLSFVRTFRVTLNSLQGYLAGVTPTEVATYQRPATGATSGRLSARGPSPVEVSQAWRDALTVMTVEAAGDLPEENWTLDVTVRLSAVLTY